MKPRFRILFRVDMVSGTEYVSVRPVNNEAETLYRECGFRSTYIQQWTVK